jgi:23S rRNA (guanine745-N1)-methyltransferase
VPVTLLCPVRECGLLLMREERRHACGNGHSFDVAKSGYVNLLQPQDSRSRNPGDTAAAAAARRRVLDAGHAAPLVESILALVPLQRSDAVLDVGCGEGHHLAAFRREYGCEAHGVDISTIAIDLAARRYRDCNWIVANADRMIPYADASFHAIASITARMNPSEFRRLLAPGGTLLVAIPGSDDLIELRKSILGEAIQRDRTARAIDLFTPSFALERTARLRHTVRLDQNAIADIMASSYRGLRTRERARIDRLGPIDVTMSRDVLLFRSL